MSHKNLTLSSDAGHFCLWRKQHETLDPADQKGVVQACDDYVMVWWMFSLGWKNYLWNWKLSYTNVFINHFGLVWLGSFILSDINLRGLFTAKAILVEEQQLYYLKHRWKNNEVHAFPNGFCPKVSVIAWLEFDIVNFKATGTPLLTTSAPFFWLYFPR